MDSPEKLATGRKKKEKTRHKMCWTPNVLS